MFTKRLNRLATLILLAATPCWAADLDWRLNGTGEWETSANWTPQGIPGFSDNVFIGRSPQPSNVWARVGSDQSIASLELHGSADLSVNPFLQKGELTVDDVSLVGTSSRLYVYPNLDINNRPITALSVRRNSGISIGSQSDLRPQGGIIELTAGSASINNQGELVGFGTIDLESASNASVLTFDNRNILEANGGVLRINSNGKVDLDGSNENGTFTVGNDSTLIVDTSTSLPDGFDGTGTMKRNSVLDIRNGWLLDTGTINIDATAGNTATIRGGHMRLGFSGLYGEVNVNSGVGRIESSELTVDDGAFNVASGATLDLASPLSRIYKSDALNRAAGSTLRISGHTQLLMGGQTFDWDGVAGNLKTEIVEGGLLEINASQIDTIAGNKFDGSIDLVDNSRLDVVNRAWVLGTNGTITKKGTGTSFIGPSGTPLTVANGTIAVDSGTLNIQIPFTTTGGNFNVASGSTALINNLSTLGDSSMNVDGTLQWNFPATLNGISNVTGSGKIVNEGNMTVTGDSTIEVAVFDWDQGTTTVEPGRTLTLDVDRVDTGNDDFNNNTITVNSGMLDVKVADGEWRLASGGVLNLRSDTQSAATLSGDRVVVTGTGTIRVQNGANGDADADILAPLTLEEGTELTMDDVGRVRLLGPTTLAGGDINASPGNGRVVTQNAPLTVTGDSTINASVYDWDQNMGTTVEQDARLVINASAIDVIGGTFNSDLTIKQGGEVDVNLAVSSWRLDGTLRMEPGPGIGDEALLSGTHFEVGDPTGGPEMGFVVVDGDGAGFITSQTTYSQNSNVDVIAGRLVHNNNVTFSGTRPGTFIGEHLFFASTGDLLINGDTHLDLNKITFKAGNVGFVVGAKLEFSDAEINAFSPFSGDGLVRAGAGSRLRVFNSAAFNVPVESSGTIDAAGVSANVPNAVGSASFSELSLTNDATLMLHLDGTAAGEFDVYSVSGETQLNGTLSVSSLSGYTPAVGDSYEFFIADGGFASGFDQFDAVDHSLPAGLCIDLQYNPNSIVLEIVGCGASGDFNGDGMYDCADIDSLVAEIAAGANTASFDLTGDGTVDNADRDAWLAEAGAANLVSGNPYLMGDANLDGSVDVSDFNLWNTNKFTATAAWCSGDFNADGSVDVSDFNLWNTNKFQSADSLTAVPEPAGLGILLAGLIGMLAMRRRKK